MSEEIDKIPEPKIEPSKDDKDRVLEESKKWKERYQAAKKEKEDLLAEKELQNKKELEEKQRFKELYEAEQKEKLKSAQELMNIKKNLVAERILFEVQKLAPDARDISYINSLIDYSQLDSESGKIPNLADQIASIKREKAWAFQSSIKPQNNGMPIFDNAAPKKPMGELTPSDLRKSIAEELLK